MYAAILARFRQSRKRLEALKHTVDNLCAMKEPKFKRKFGKFGKRITHKIPGLQHDGIYMIQYKTESYQ